jgi:thiol reductant ABC exporter CydD subunit
VRGRGAAETGDASEGDLGAAPAPAHGRGRDRRGSRRPDLGALAPELRALTRRTAVLSTLATACVVAQGVLLAHAIALGVDGIPTTGPVVLTLGGLAAAVLLRAGLGAWAEIDGRRTGHRAVAALRARLVRTTLESASSGAMRPGELAATSVHGAEAVAVYAGRYVPQRVVAGIGPVIALLVVLVADPLSAGLLAFAMPIAIVFLILVGMQARDATDERNAGLGLLDGHLLDVLRGLPVLRAFGREHAQVEQVRHAGEAYRAGTMAVLRAAFLSSFVLEFVAMLGTALVAVACGIRLAGGHMEFPAAITALVLAPEVFAPLRRLGAEYHAAADAEPVLRALVEGLERDGVVPGGVPGAGTPDPARDDVRLTAVRTPAGDRGRPALDGADLVVPAGRTVALVGPSGSGKTTALRLLAGLRAPESGTVSCGGRDLATCDLDAWRGGVAWVPQHPVLLPATLRENVRLGAPADDAAVRDALTAVGLGPLVAALPAGLETPLGDGALPLSAGERRRVAMARALVRDPRLVLVDEPTANLDAVTADEVVVALGRLLRGRTGVVATHDPAPLRLADETVALDGGRIVPAAEATPSCPGAADGRDCCASCVAGSLA